MGLFSACQKSAVEEKRPSINIDSVLALPPDTLEWEELEIPSGVTAHLTLPSGYSETLTGGTYHFAE